MVDINSTPLFFSQSMWTYIRVFEMNVDDILYYISGVVSQFPGIQIVNEKERSVDCFDIMTHTLYVFKNAKVYVKMALC